MFFIRRTATRALTATPSRAFFVQPRSITTCTAAAFRTKQQKWVAPYFQRRFASDEVTKTEESAEELATEGFAQTATEAPVDESVTPAAPADQESAPAGIDALEAAAHRGQAHSPSPGKTIYVGNLYYEVTEDQLKRVFSRFGAIDSLKIVYDNRGMSRGFAYIDFQTTNDAQSAVDNLDMQVFEGRNLVVQFHKQKAGGAAGPRAPFNTTPSPPSKTLFIGNMSFEMSDKDLNDLFRDIRNVMDVRVAIDRRTGQPRGFAHADFIDVASAVRAQAVLKEKIIYGRQLRVDFSKSSTQQQREVRGEGEARSGGDEE
ncbi:RNA binding domain-containing protein [Pleomassaria siparia CBS 279.74]|uniref:RNA binding domain-containing protein n=1 Tax=Pleomassaria siparia CBS 279.74 TaxID=1314801 RepID=A0A6G1JXV9_9PLEO|nr:RNA binding domain-containing protein [Pleomassaria siparia CBS 279.74]